MKFLSVLLSVGLFQVNADHFHLNSAYGESEVPLELVKSLLGVGSSLEIDEESVQLTGPNSTCAKQFFGGLNLFEQNGEETYTGGTLGFDEGIIVATGVPKFIEGQDKTSNSACFSQDSNGGDGTLTDVIQLQTYDSCALSFNFKPADGIQYVSFNYAFGSEEYLEWVGSIYNDAFVLLLNDVNIAVVPGTDTDEAGNSIDGTPVSINNVNKFANSDFYIDNDPQNYADYDEYGTETIRFEDVPYPNFEADGFTTNLMARGALKENEWNTLSFRIADTGDCYLDSWVMIEAGTLEGTVQLPASTESGALPTVTVGGATGDPHFIMWSSEKYDFHGVCDLVLLENPAFGLGKGMDIHIRTMKTRLFSYISSAVLRIGEDTFEVRRDGYWLNGKKDASLESGISGYSIKFKQLTEKANHDQQQYIVTLNSMESISFKTFGDMIRVDVESAKGESFKESHGLMGTYGTDSERVGRDHITVIQDFNEFGKEWQVGADEVSLFHNVEGPQAPEECKMPIASANRRRLGETKVSMEDAEVACARLSGNDRDMCIFDVLAIDDTDVAGAY